MKDGAITVSQRSRYHLAAFALSCAVLIWATDGKPVKHQAIAVVAINLAIVFCRAGRVQRHADLKEIARLKKIERECVCRGRR